MASYQFRRTVLSANKDEMNVGRKEAGAKYIHKITLMLESRGAPRGR